MTIEYVAVERPVRAFQEQWIADKYREFAHVYMGETRIAVLYPPSIPYGNDSVGAVFFTRQPDYSDPFNPVSSKAVSIEINMERLTETLEGLVELLPPF